MIDVKNKLNEENSYYWLLRKLQSLLLLIENTFFVSNKKRDIITSFIIVYSLTLCELIYKGCNFTLNNSNLLYNQKISINYIVCIQFDCKVKYHFHFSLICNFICIVWVDSSGYFYKSYFKNNKKMITLLESFRYSDRFKNKVKANS
jgi:CDP-diglyceride synthetase